MNHLGESSMYEFGAFLAIYLLRLPIPKMGFAP